jgi:hypothetical protein
MAKIVPIGLFAANRDKNLQKRGIKPTILAIHISGNADERQICPFLRVRNNNFVYCGGNPVPRCFCDFPLFHSIRQFKKEIKR